MWGWDDNKDLGLKNAIPATEPEKTLCSYMGLERGFLFFALYLSAFIKS